MSTIESLEATVRMLADRLAIIELYAAYAVALDDKDKAMLERVFDDQSYFESANPAVPARTGVDANWDRLMHRHAEQRFAERHITTAPVITWLDGDHAEAIAECVIIKRENGGPPQFEMVGRYEDEMVRRNGRWVFARRRFVPDA